VRRKTRRETHYHCPDSALHDSWLGALVQFFRYSDSEGVRSAAIAVKFSLDERPVNVQLAVV